MAFRKTAIITILLTALLSPLTTSANDKTANDLPQTHPNFTAINYLIKRDVISGGQNSELNLKTQLSLAETLKISLRSAKPNYFEGKRLESLLASPYQFEKVPGTHWAFPYFVYAKQRDLITTEQNNPDKKITRKEALKILLNAHKVTLSDNVIRLFGDVPPQHPYYAYFAYIYGGNILLPLDTNHYLPEDLISREEFFITTYRLLFKENVKTSFQIIPVTQKCTATFYSDFFEGRNTASGVPFTQNNHTAAHLTFEFGTKIEIISPKNGNSVIVEINDRGPYDDRFCFDLSKSAFEILGNTNSGWIPIEYRIIDSRNNF